MRVGRFLSNVVEAVQSNRTLYSFGLGVQPERSAEDIRPRDEETRLDLALKEAALLDLERIVIITDGKPVYSPGSETEELCDEALETLDAMARAGVLVLVVLLGYDYDMVRFYKRLEQNPSITLIELAASSDVAEMMQKLSGWL